MINVTISAVAVETSASARLEKPATTEEAEVRSELFDFANILGVLITSPPPVHSVLPELIAGEPSADYVQSLAANGGVEDSPESSRLSDMGQQILPSAVGSDRKALGRARLIGDNLNATSSTRSRADVDTTIARQFRNIAEPSVPDRGRDITTSFSAAELGTISNERLPVDRIRPDLAHSTRLGGQAESNRTQYSLADSANNKNAAGLATSLPPSGAPPSIATSFAAPALASPMPTRNRLSSQAEIRVSDDTNAQSTANPLEPARLLSISELVGVAGRLQLQNDVPNLLSTGGMDSQLPLPQGAHFQVPLTQGHNLPTPQTIAVPLGSPHWPNVFSSSIARLATEQITEATLTVTPSDLGTINIEIALEGNRVSLNFTAENGQVREAVNASLPVLQDMLEQSGLSLGQSSVGQEAPRDTNRTQHPSGQTRNLTQESDAIAGAAATSVRTSRPMLDEGRVDFYA
jgi:hypothetical protein